MMASWPFQALFMAVVVTGLALGLELRWTAPYLLIVLVHPVLAIIVSVLMMRGLSAHAQIDQAAELRSTPATRRRLLLGPIAILGLALLATSDLIPGAVTFLGLVVPALGYLLLSLFRFLSEELKARPVRWATALATGLVFVGGWAVLLGTGLVMLFGWAVGGLSWVVTLHILAGITVALIHTLHVLASAFYRLKTRADSSARGALLTNMGMLISAVVALGLIWVAGEGRQRVSFVNPAIDRSEVSGTVDPALFSMDETCAAGGCHESIGDMHQDSAHELSPRSPHFAAITEVLFEERGAEGLAHCASCHYPGGLFEEAIPRASLLKTAEGVGCMGCHALEGVSAAEGDGYHSGRRLTFAFDPDHAKLLRAAANNSEGWERRLLMANISAHARAMQPEILGTDDHCLACHHIHIPKPSPSLLEVPGCVTCHMEGQAELTLGGERLNHRFLGSNATLAQQRGNSAFLKDIEAFISGSFRHSELPVPWTLLERRYDIPDTIVWLRMMVGTTSPPRAGTKVSFEVVSDNVAVGKPFPSAPLDLIEVWQETTVIDDKERILLRSGHVGPTEPVPDNIPRLGGHLEDDEGNRLWRHEIWRGHEVKGRRIPPGQGIRDSYSVMVPADTERLIVTSRWLMRDLNPTFRTFALDKDAPPTPTLEVAAVRSEIELLD